MPNYLTVEEVMAKTGLSRSTVYTYRWDGRLPPPRMVRDGKMLFSAADIGLFMRTRKTRARKRGAKR